MNVRTERVKYDNHEIIKLLFDYDKDIIAKIRTIPGARWSRSLSCWYVADQRQKITALQNIGIKVEQKEVSNTVANDANAELLIRFSDYMKARRYSINTINSYIDCLKIFLNYHSLKHYLEIDNDDVTLFNSDYILKQKLSATYQGQFINAIKLFYAKNTSQKTCYRKLRTPT